MTSSGKTGIKVALCLFLSAVPAWSSPIVQVAAPVFTFERSVSFNNPLKRAIDQPPQPPPNTCPAHEQPIFINHNDGEFTVDVNWMNNHGMAKTSHATTPNMADPGGRDYNWGGIWPRVTMRITQESYRGRLHESWRIQWNTLIRGAIAVFLVHTAGHPGCG
ncbi:hypothetical protein CKM354_001193800 [Cercospora kikuchii]|uniref:Uncharacterized protein n=1 Tax=Cercospora kikuchii TaxID=84275 RepID=A0A9P3CZ79_9PEZI|nr:uncharacterized protein CKM354_001193800 [Cercospora kikuchii]GIZ48895.1 hypothetical protein CKM354_001193800 [Cercospora kikuchii]